MCQNCSELTKFQCLKKTVVSGKTSSAKSMNVWILSSVVDRLRIRTIITDVGNTTWVPAAASIFQGTTGQREQWGNRTLSQEQ